MVAATTRTSASSSITDPLDAGSRSVAPLMIAVSTRSSSRVLLTARPASSRAVISCSRLARAVVSSRSSTSSRETRRRWRSFSIV